jgi:hypothetical protein
MRMARVLPSPCFPDWNSVHRPLHGGGSKDENFSGRGTKCPRAGRSCERTSCSVSSLDDLARQTRLRPVNLCQSPARRSELATAKTSIGSRYST